MQKINWINTGKNELVSTLRGLNLQSYLENVDKTYLCYRNTIGISRTMSFGVEIEYEDLFKKATDLYIKRFHSNWDSKTDGSLTVGGEVISPILHDTEDCWEELKNICHNLKNRGANTCNNAGAHIHIGAHTLGENVKAWENFLNIWMVYEHVFFRFFYGDKLNQRKGIKDFAEPIANILKSNYKDMIYFLKYRLDNKNIIKFLYEFLPRSDKYQAINFRNVLIRDINETEEKNTIEFRCPNATVEEVIWQNNINTATKLITTCKNNNFDQEFLQYKIAKIMQNRINEVSYSEICLKDALELVDLIFDNNLDKIYFLRQYLKNFEVLLNGKSAVYAKKMVRGR